MISEYSVTKKLELVLQVAIRKVLSELGLHELPLQDLNIQKPKIESHGDYATNIALLLSKLCKMEPLELADRISQNVPKVDIIDSVSAAGIGFINININHKWLQQNLKNVIKPNYDVVVQQEDNQPIQIEYVSVNPTGQLHVGHARGAIIGSCLAKLLQKVGYKVQQEYYVNDAGTQMDNFTDSVWAFYLRQHNIDKEVNNLQYQGTYPQNLATKIATLHGTKFINSDSKRDEFKQLLLELVLSNIKETLNLIGVKHDNWFRESSLFESKLFFKTVDMLKEKGLVYENQGAKWFKSSKFGASEDDVIIRTGGKIGRAHV